MAETELLLERGGEQAETGAHSAFFVLPRVADSDSIERFARVIEQG